MEPIKVVARYTDGVIIKGFTHDFSPNKDRFHLIPAGKGSEEAIEVLINRLKAIFIVRDFDGNPQYKERKTYLKGEAPAGLKLELTFKDGEVMIGSTSLGYDPKRQGVFIIPVDPNGNNTRVYAVSSALRTVRQLFDHLLQDAHPTDKAFIRT